ncbi:ubiquinone biosynthesis monooxygenase COQ6, mitochondrial-like isoform X2 [Corticium candelabrum]|uniref:ubiquinone biosynthesis monooxygenase COQ6, mitochondrial-like isoform X2 n=1 Tax=Corticium candelabrum TaxID=121492 RepID=UPI002E259825|nr:ubiquinone biosynthesis monooxygenase COQ6, mitochondrial-like isoform X2 [Corticium candelabrum]
MQRFLCTSGGPVHFDVLVAGGGLVGACLACSLGRLSVLKDRKLAVLEGQKLKSLDKYSKSYVPETYSNRVSAITPGSAALLDEIGVWQDIKKTRFKQFNRMQVWDACSEAHISFNCDDVAAPRMGYIVENDVIVAALHERLKSFPNIEVLEGVRVEAIQSDNKDKASWLSCTLSNSSLLNTKLLIGADGATSTVRRAANMENYSYSYNQMAVVATLQLSEPSDNLTAWQRFLPSGPIALLPLSENASSLVWSTSPDHARSLLEMSGDSFVDAVNSAFCEDYPRHTFVESSLATLNAIIQTVGGANQTVFQLPPSILNVTDKSRASFPLHLGHSPQYVRRRLALIGDAAHRVHPMAGQGVNLGFSDVQCLANLIKEAAGQGQDLGSLHYLRSYEKERLQNVVPMMAAIDGLNRLFTTSVIPLVWARALGLQLTDAFAPVKRSIMEFAMK